MVEKNMRRINYLLISIVAIAFVALYVNVAHAGGWLSSVESIQLDTSYAGYVDDQYGNVEDIDAYSFYVPAKGTITLYMESPNYFCWNSFKDKYKFYSSSNVDQPIYGFQLDSTYSEARGVYYASTSIQLSPGKYYFTFSGETEFPYEFYLKYRPSFSSTSIARIKGVKKGFSIRARKAGSVSGYQIQYARNKKFHKAKAITTTKAKRTIKKLKRKKIYWVRVRTYKTIKVNGVYKTYYSKWAAKKKIKTK